MIIQEDNNSNIKIDISNPDSAQADLVETLYKNLKIDSTVPREENAKSVIGNLRLEIEKIKEPDKRSHAFFELAMYARSVGEKELGKECADLSHSAEEEFMLNSKTRDSEKIGKIKMQINAYLSGDKVTLDTLESARAKLPEAKILSIPSGGDEAEVETDIQQAA
ncbi:MAG: hypothetical protein RL641_856 [Candidatus Parcubacteria bacterium]|jgi:hypothetical protein